MPATKSGGTVTPSHLYHGEAHALSGELERPIQQTIERHAEIKLEDRRGGHLTRVVEDVSVEGLVIFAKGHTRVSGSRSKKTNGWVTLSTSILEGLNVFEIITASRLVSQVSTEHPYQNGHVPHVTFLGTQFNDLRVSGVPVELTLDFAICGRKPNGDKSYLEDVTFLKKVRQQTEKIAKASGLPKDLKEQYAERLADVDELIRSAGNGKRRDGERQVVCSLVQKIKDIPIPGVKTIGNLLLIPDLGTVRVAELVISEKKYPDSERPNPYFELTSLVMKLGCVGTGSLKTTPTLANGHTVP
jgi:hypothetical protein